MVTISDSTLAIFTQSAPSLARSQECNYVGGDAHLDQWQAIPFALAKQGALELVKTGWLMA
jgi:hypothetical protein